MMFADTW